MADRPQADDDPPRRNGNAPRPTEDAPEQPSEFEQFETLMGKLIRVPKSDVDAKRKTA
jgi:hypothetical protein